MTIRPRRSMLFMPGSNAHALEKARTLPADGLIFDLEDSVAPEAKEQARDQVAAAVKSGDYKSREVLIRVNALDTPWGLQDINAAAAAVPDGVLVPKVSTPQHLEAIGRRLFDMQADARTRIWAMIETPQALFNILALAAEANDSESRLAGFVIGPNDLAKETRARIVPGRAPMLSWFSTCIAAARLYGLDILDGVYNDFRDAEGFALECAQGRDLGFDGKTLIHPDQIGPCNTAFSPAADEVAHARAIIAAFDQPDSEGKGVIQVEGRMVERLHLDMARRTVAIAEAIAQHGG
jgi:citrate lyase subunit beta/citryl-CoA lyase